jgi:CheY-like chemotaxis protein
VAEKEFAAQNERVRDQAIPARDGSPTLRMTRAVHAPQHVLIVDDNRDCADSLQLVLASFGHDAQVAYDGVQAMQVLREGGVFDLVLLDLSMPGMNGFDLARRLRNATTPCPSIIAISGWADSPTKQKAREAGIDRYLVKPVDIEGLREMLDGAESEN